MKAKKQILSLSQLAKEAGKIKIDKKLNTIEETAFFKKKMEKGAKTLAIAGVPK